ncbi:MAG TPA: MOSC domain-containing protein [Thermoleophilaceae bacterium]|jgi:hypothetical protein
MPGVVESIHVADAAEHVPRAVERATAVAGRGLEGDRYFHGTGTFSDWPGGRDLTLIEAEAAEAAGIAPGDARRNVVVRGVDLNALVGSRFRVGEVECEGLELAEPCAHLERLTRPGVLRTLAGRGGLRAAIVSGGEIAVGDAVG